MLRNYLLVAMRGLLRQRVSSFINVFGLSLGIAAWIVVLTLIQHELNYDRHHQNAERIYRVVTGAQNKEGKVRFWNRTVGPLGPVAAAEFPEVEAATRVLTRGMWVRHGGKDFLETVCVADANILDTFTYPLVKGDPQTALAETNSALLTESTARKLFGDEDPMGRTVAVTHEWMSGDFEVTGILRDMPASSTSDLKFDFLTATVPDTGAMRSFWWEWYPDTPRVDTYLLLAEGADPRKLESKAMDFAERHFEIADDGSWGLHLQPLLRVHLHSGADYGISGPGYGHVRDLYGYAIIAGLIALTAGINFTNLATARSARRAREVGLRKVVGGRRSQVMVQFLSESILISLAALLVALALADMGLLLLSGLIHKDLSLTGGNLLVTGLGAVAIALIVGLASGAIPALFLSAFQPAEAMAGRLRRGARGASLRKGLVILQLAACLVAALGTLVVRHQMAYMTGNDPGFDRENVIVLPVFGANPALRERHEAVRQEFLKHPGVVKATASSLPPGFGFDGVSGSFVVAESGQREHSMRILPVDEEFLEAYEIELTTGRNFSRQLASDAGDAFILNRAAVRQLGWQDPVGRRLEWPEAGRGGVVIGVIEDFHNQSLHHRIEPLVLYQDEAELRDLSLWIRPDQIPETLASLESTWKRLVPGGGDREFGYVFLEDFLYWQYAREIALGKILGAFSILAMVVACMGLFALSVFAAEERTKEIGVRKVVGASTARITGLLCRDFGWLVLVANAIAWPIVYLAARAWLEGFAYRTELGVGIFVLSGVGALVVTLATVGAQAVRAAAANPVKALRYE